MNYTGAVFNVKNYGAKGDGITNDAVAIQNAIYAADKVDGSTVYFPTGTYAVQSPDGWGLSLGNLSNVRLLGDGKNLTTIKAANGSKDRFLFLGNNNTDNFTFQDLTLDANHQNGTSVGTVTQITSSSNLQYLNVKINAEGAAAFFWKSNRGVSMKNSEIIGQINFLGDSKQVFIDGTKFFGTGYSDMLISGFGVQMLSIINSVGQNLDTSDPKNGKWVKGRFFVDQSVWGISQNHYLGNNQTIDMATIPALGQDENSGEQIMWEMGDNESQLLGMVTSTTLNTVSINLPPTTVDSNYYISIVGGKGIGQSRQVKSFNQSASTYTLHDNWNIQPDQSSVIMANRQISNAVVYGNTLDGDPATFSSSGLNTFLNGDAGGSVGVQAYFGANNLIVDSNTFNELRTGVRLWAEWDAKDNNPINFTQVSNNTFTDDRIGVNFVPSGPQGTSILGNSVRNNNFNNVGTVLKMGPLTPSNTPSSNKFPSVNMTVFENNALGTGHVSINQGNGNIQNTIFLNNTTSDRAPLNVGVVDGNFYF